MDQNPVDAAPTPGQDRAARPSGGPSWDAPANGAFAALAVVYVGTGWSSALMVAGVVLVWSVAGRLRETTATHEGRPPWVVTVACVAGVVVGLVGAGTVRTQGDGGVGAIALVLVCAALAGVAVWWFRRSTHVVPTPVAVA